MADAVLGNAPGSNAFKNRRMRPGPVNEQDKSTVVSIYNKIIVERKSTIQPGHFRIPAGSVEKPSLLVVGQSRWWREVDPDQDLFEVPVGSAQVANSIVVDYWNGLIGANEFARPGLFFLIGAITYDSLIKNHQKALKEAEAKQNAWYQALVHMGDVSWARTNGNPLSISEDMRAAAKALNLTAKDWMSDFTMMDNVRCVACGQPRNPKFPICPSCHIVVDKKLYDSLQLGIGEEPKVFDPKEGIRK